MNIKDLIKNNTVTFSHFRENNFYYTVGRDDELTKSYKTYQFIVPLSDISGATLKFQDKAIFFMRWIKKAMNEGALVEI